MKLRIVGQDWDVRHVKRIFDHPTTETRGYVDDTTREIVLLQDSGNEEDLLHEVLHACEYAFNLSLEEDEVQILARSLLAICRDNPHFADYLRGAEG